MRYTVESWSSEYGPSAEPSMLEASQPPRLDVELAPERWMPLSPSVGRDDVVVFVDGVRRVDANIWIERDDDMPVLGLCAVYAAGAVVADRASASLVESTVGRGLFTSATEATDVATDKGTYTAHVSPGETAEELWLAIQSEMGRQEGEIARRFDGHLLVVDGPLSHGRHPDGVVGFIKRQHTHYLPPELRRVLVELPTGRRTPLFLVGGRTNRYSWYQRLAVGAGPGGGIVRCETSASMSVSDAIGRAPQNLYPIAGLERELRRRLGDQRLMERALRRAAR